MKGPYVKIKIGIGVRWVSDKGMFPLIQCTEVSEMKSKEKKNMVFMSLVKNTDICYLSQCWRLNQSLFLNLNKKSENISVSNIAENLINAAAFDIIRGTWNIFGILKCIRNMSF